MDLRTGQAEHRVSIQPSWGPSVMVVEDDPLIGELLKVRLESVGYQVSWAKTGREALDRLFDIMPKLLLLDLGLPLIDGFEVLRHVRRHRVFANVPIVVLTAHNDAEDVRRAISLGATDYLTKPFEAAAFLKRVAHHLAAAGGKHRKAPDDVVGEPLNGADEWMLE
jgi:DNA-binding response OmpR family regulator